MSAECKVCGRDLDYDFNCAACDAKEVGDRLGRVLAAAQYEILVLKKAKAENDERFQLEIGNLKAELAVYQGPRLTSAGKAIKMYQEENARLKAELAQLKRKD